MIDSWMVRQIQPTLNQFALDWVPKWLRANSVTVIGFLVGLLVLPLLRDQAYLLAFAVILVNRFLDGLDGAIARRDGISDFGGFLDLTRLLEGVKSSNLVQIARNTSPDVVEGLT